MKRPPAKVVEIPLRAARLAVLVVCVGSFGALGPASTTAAPSSGGSVVLVAAARNEVAKTVPLPDQPARISYGAGSFWVVAPDAGTVMRVDPQTGAVERLALGEEPYDAAVGDGALWVPDHDGSNLRRVDLGTHAVTTSRRLGAPALAVAYGLGAAWVVLADARLLRVDPKTLRVTARVGGVAPSRERLEPKIAIGDRAVWVAAALGNGLVRVDSMRLRVTRRYAEAGRGVALCGGAAWAADGERSVWRFVGARRTPIRVGRFVLDVAAGAGSVWAIDGENLTLSRINPARRRVVERIKLPQAPVAVAAGGGFVAVAVR